MSTRQSRHTFLRVVLCETVGEKVLVCIRLPGRTLQGLGHECAATVLHCVYFGEITVGGRVFTVHGKNHSVDCVEKSLTPLNPQGCLHLGHMVALWLSVKAALSGCDTHTWFLLLLHHYLPCPLIGLSVLPLVLIEAERHTICHDMLLLCWSLQEGDVSSGLLLALTTGRRPRLGLCCTSLNYNKTKHHKTLIHIFIT